MATLNDPNLTWRELLARAATVSREQELDLDAFMRAAWSAFVDARPGMKEHLEEMQLRANLDQMRAAGRVGTA